MDIVKGAAVSTPSSVSEVNVLPSRPLVAKNEEKKIKGGKDSYLRIINKKKGKKEPE